MTVVRATRPTSGKPGDKAIWTERGEWLGWVGGSCAEPSARRAASQALADGACRLIHLTNDETDFVRPGVEVAAMTCHSGGSLEIYVEPFLPRPSLVVFGRSPIASAVRMLAGSMNYRVVAADLRPDAADGEARPSELPAAEVSYVRTLGELDALPSGRRSVVVASHGHHEVEALEWALRGGPGSSAGYVGLVTSRQRLANVQERLRARGLAPAQLDRLRAPAGLPIGATEPEEVALSVLAEIVAHAHASSSTRPAESGHTTRARSVVTEASGSPSDSAAQSCCAVAPAPAAPATTPRARPSCCDVDEPAVAAIVPPAAATARFSAIVLCAGLSRRMGAQNKLLLPIAGEPMIRRVLANVLAAGFVEVVAVLGHEAEEVRRAIAPLGVRTVYNERFESGQVSSVRAGLGALERRVDAVMVCLGDQPLITSADLQAMQAAYAARPEGSILIPVRGEQRGNPVIVDWQSGRDTLERGLNFGCRHFIEENPERVYRWPASSEHFIRDVDERADYETVVSETLLSEALGPQPPSAQRTP
jgi:CTP:molybdopterin cytidylyltransferase MocA/xanthine/CO dehydrogenase XdhC/CoxF family maturation factor